MQQNKRNLCFTVVQKSSSSEIIQYWNKGFLELRGNFIWCIHQNSVFKHWIPIYTGIPELDLGPCTTKYRSWYYIIVKNLGSTLFFSDFLFSVFLCIDFILRFYILAPGNSRLFPELPHPKKRAIFCQLFRHCIVLRYYHSSESDLSWFRPQSDLL